MKNQHSPPPQKPRRLPPLMEEDPFRYRRPIEFDLTSDVNLESGTSFYNRRPQLSSDQGMTNLPDWEDISDEVKRVLKK